MNRQQAKELLPIIQAFAEGKVIQFRTNNISKWIEITTPTFDLLHEYRIKPEPKYRPFVDKEECWQEMLKHQPFGWIKYKEVTKSLISVNRGLLVKLFPNCGIKHVEFTNNNVLKYKDLIY